MTEPTKWQRRWQWITDFPTTNGQLVVGIILLTLVILVPLTLMALGLKDRLDLTLIGLLLGGVGVTGATGTVQKVKKWQEAPDSSVEEPGAGPPVVEPRPEPNGNRSVPGMIPPGSPVHSEPSD